MAGRRKHLNADFSNAQLEAVLHFDAGKARSSVRANVDCGAGAVREFTVAGDEIGMEMSLENVADANALFIGCF